MNAGPECRLAVYGTLAPGRSNHAVLDGIGGHWRRGEVEGDLHPHGWGATHGYPGMIWRPGARRVAVDLLESPALPGHWARLDAFEGDDYRRIVVPVHAVPGADGPLLAHLYVLARTPDRGLGPGAET